MAGNQSVLPQFDKHYDQILLDTVPLDSFNSNQNIIESRQSVILIGEESPSVSRKVMNAIRKSPPKIVAGLKLLELEDSGIGLKYNFVIDDFSMFKVPDSNCNCLTFYLEQHAFFHIVHCENETGLGLYTFVQGENKDESITLVKKIEEAVSQIIDDVQSAAILKKVERG